ncbi:DHHA1 domain-containing protein [Metabacillus litoralis]|uniref:alanyl-tRNA editing protein n=1 Tax=Metabacillus litoralis TaxID=152268 RepID=UPI00203C34BB|nr:DHHA1 domain-containing protein [Metabacillus litoralis]MCM3160060.1 DHHA1 domain-containing protein [Metabacillus litoralis]
MTKKLYYDDVYQTKFSSKVIKRNNDESGCFVVLQETAFYPTGGGQPFDKGTLNEINVLKVEEVDGEIRHYMETSIDMEEVNGVIDWERRFDHMQQHAGQHILTAAFEDNLGYKTLSFHLGEETCTIDLDTSFLTDEEIHKAEKLANKIILENRPILTKWVDKKEELSGLPLRKELAVSEHIRLVIIPEYDYNGCGGTHPRSTGEVSLLKILTCEKQKKYTRVHFVCGGRLLKQLQEKQEVLKKLTTQLSSPQQEIDKAVNRLLQHTKSLEERIVNMQDQLLQFEGKELLEKVEKINGYNMIHSVFHNRTINELQLLAKEIVEGNKNTIVLFVNDDQNKLQVVCARSEDIEFNLNQLLKGVLPSINGKGGGKPSFVQGGGERNILPEVLLDQLIKGLS